MQLLSANAASFTADPPGQAERPAAQPGQQETQAEPS